MFAGEKERKTLEPLLTTRAGRGQILTGKFLAVSRMGLISTITMLAGLFLGFYINSLLSRFVLYTDYNRIVMFLARNTHYFLCILLSSADSPAANSCSSYHTRITVKLSNRHKI
jgi:ABC-type Na+ efflux pump permease subunit